MTRPKKRPRTESTVEDAQTIVPKPQAVSPTIKAPSMAPLCEAHQSLLANLKDKYDVLPNFTISSTPISKRATRVLEHLRKDDGDPRPRIAFLHARPAEVCKMITIAEVAKRDLSSEKAKGGTGAWYQYNMMYELPPRPKEPDTIDETILPDGAQAEDESDEDEFEVMESRNRFERAVVPQPTQRPAMSLSIFLSRAPVPELKARADVTVQSNETKTT